MVEVDHERGLRALVAQSSRASKERVIVLLLVEEGLEELGLLFNVLHSVVHSGLSERTGCQLLAELRAFLCKHGGHGLESIGE